MGEVVNALWARCPDCDHKWIVAHLPIEVMTMVHLAKAAACPRGCDGKPLVASTTPSRDEVSHVG